MMAGQSGPLNRPITLRQALHIVAALALIIVFVLVSFRW